MAFLPRYESKQTGTTQDTFRPLSPMTEGYKQIQQSGEMLTKIGLEVEKINSVREKAAAQLDLQTKLSDVKIRAQKDPDPKNKQKYLDEMDSILAEAGSGISNPGTRKNFSITAGEMGLTYRNGIETDNYQKVVQQTKDILALTREQTVTQASSGSDLTVTTASIQGYTSALDEAVANGVITQETRDKAIYDARIDIVKNRVEAAIYSDNPQAAVDVLSQDEALSTGLTEAEINKYKTVAENQVKTQAKVDKIKTTVLQTANAHKIVQELSANPAMYTPSQIDRKVLSGELSSGDGSRLKKFIRLDKTNIVEITGRKNKVLQDLLKFYDPENDTILKGGRSAYDQSVFLEKWHSEVLDLTAEGYMTSNSYDKLMQLGNGLVYDAVMAADTSQAAKRYSKLASATLSGFTGSFEAFGDMLMGKVSKGQKVTNDDIQNIIMEQVKDENPGMTDAQAEAYISGEEQTFDLVYNADTGEFE